MGNGRRSSLAPELDLMWFPSHREPSSLEEEYSDPCLSSSSSSLPPSSSSSSSSSSPSPSEAEGLRAIASKASSLLDLLEDPAQHLSSDPVAQKKLLNTTAALRRKIQEELNSKRSTWRKVVTGSREKSVRQHLQERKAEPKVVKLIDKISFTGGVLGLLITEFIVVRFPQHFWIWYLMVIPSLLAIRYHMYRAEKYLYFMIDFCYFANFMCFLGLLFFPKSITVFQINFAFACGPLSWAIVAWRNSLVFHSVDKVTSVFIHAFPPLLMYCWKWFPPAEGEVVPKELLTAPFHYTEVFPLCFFFYMFWQVAYFLKTEMLDRHILDSDPALATSLRHLSKDSHNSLHRLVLKVVRAVGILKKDEQFDPSTTKTKIIFMSSQLFFSILTCLPVPVIYYSYWAHMAFLFYVFFVSIYNGAGYYIEVFSTHYSSKFKKHEAPSDHRSSAAATASDGADSAKEPRKEK